MCVEFRFNYESGWGGLGFNLQKECIGRGSTLYPNLIAKENRECFCVPIKEISLVFANCKGGAILFVAKAFFSLFLPLVSPFTSPSLRHFYGELLDLYGDTLQQFSITPLSHRVLWDFHGDLRIYENRPASNNTK